MVTRPIETIAMVGSGFMGTQIGLLCAVHGVDVRLYDISQTVLDSSAQSQAEELADRLEAGTIAAVDRDSILGRIHYTTDLTKAVSNADLVIEAVPERLEPKREIFRELDSLCPEHTILATNSSSIRVSAIEDVVQRRDRVVNLHFYAIVWQRPMVDIMGGTETTAETMATVRQFALRIGVTPLMVRKESTGFVFNRVWRAVKRECLQVVDEGVASHEDVDRAWIIFSGMSMGPFGFMDLIGLDVICDIEMVYYSESGDESDAPPSILLDKIERGELGVKTGMGFYDYPHPAYEEPDWIKG